MRRHHQAKEQHQAKEKHQAKETNQAKDTSQAKVQNKDKPKLHGVPTSDIEEDEDPEDILESWMTTIMKDVQQARKIYLGLKSQPTQRFQCQALLADAQKCETYWSRMNSQKKDAAKTWLPFVKKSHDEIGGFRKHIKVSKGALSGVEEK